MRGRLTLAQFFALFLLATGLVLGVFFWRVYSQIRISVAENAESQRTAAATRVTRKIEKYLHAGDEALDALTDDAHSGACNFRTRDSAKRCLWAALRANPSLTEVAFTHAVQIDGGEDPIAFAHDGRWQISVFRDEKDAVRIRSTEREAEDFVDHVRCGRFSQALDALTPENDVPSVDPLAADSFAIPAMPLNWGKNLDTDLAYLTVDQALPEPERRAGFQSLRVVAVPEFLGVLRASVIRDGVDTELRDEGDGSLNRISADAGGVDPRYDLFLTDEQGRLMGATGPGDKLADFEEDLRMVAAHPSPKLAAAIAQPEFSTLDIGHPRAKARVRVGDDDWDVSYHVFGPPRDYGEGLRQDWRLMVIGRANQEVQGLADRMRELARESALVLGALLLLGALGLQSARRGLLRVVGEVQRVESFDFASRRASSTFKDLKAVLDSLEHAKTALRALGKYAPIALVRELYASNREPTLGGELKEVTLLFSDIQGFTALSEQLRPTELAERLGRYLEAMTAAVHKNDGVVDKYIGDAVMALWNAPHACEAHPVRACAAAVACLEATRALYAEPSWRGPPLVTRIGIHVDQVLVGHFGAPDRMSYTALGDGVNLAARLESLNKQYRTTVLVSDAVRRRAEPGFVFRRVDRVAVKGKKEGVDVYELLGAAGCARSAAIDAYERAFEAYLQGAFEQAAAALEPFGQDGPSVVLRARCLAFLRRPPPAGWSGVHVAEHK